jgi:hypothetical protein
VDELVEKELQEEDTYVPTRRKKKTKKVVHGVIIRKVNMRTSSGNLSILKSSQSCVARKRRMAWWTMCNTPVMY